MTDPDTSSSPQAADDVEQPVGAVEPAVDSTEQLADPVERAGDNAERTDEGEAPAVEQEVPVAAPETEVLEVGDTADGDEAIAATVEAPAQVVEPGPPSRVRRRLRLVAAFIASFVAFTIVGSTLGAAAIYAYRSAYDGRIPAGIDVGGVDISGLAPAEAEARVAAAYSAMTQGSIILDGVTGDRVIAFAEFGRSVDTAFAIQRAMAVAKDGDLLHESIATARTALDGVSIAPTVNLDVSLLERAIDRAVRSYERPARNAVVTSAKDGVTVQPAQFGVVMDRATILDAALEQVGRTDAPSAIVIPVKPTPVEPAITTGEAEEARRNIDLMARPVVVKHGDEEWKIAASSVRSWIVVVPTTDGRITYDIDRELVAASVEKLRKKIDREPINAKYLTSKSGRVLGVKAHKNGRSLDAAITADRVARAVISRAYGVTAETAKAHVTAVAPDLTTAEAEKTAPLLKMISSHTTWFPYGERNFYGANIWIPGRIINGTVLAPGETFDFWKVVGYPSPSRGFGAGGAIINGRTEPTGALAGGICSCSTTLFNTAAKAGLKLGARRMHYYYIDRYPMGLDATVWISSSGSKQNMTFTNDTKYPILIVNKNWRSGSRGYVRFEMWSVPNGRKVRFTKPIIKNVRPATTSVVHTSALPKGATRVEESEHDGMDVWRTRIVTDAKGKVIHKDVIYSHYARVNGLILKGK